MNKKIAAALAACIMLTGCASVEAGAPEQTSGTSASGTDPARPAESSAPEQTTTSAQATTTSAQQPEPVTAEAEVTEEATAKATTEAVVTEEVSDTEEQETAEPSGEIDLRGVWECFSEACPNGRYYLFYADGTGGAALDMEYGIGVALEYTIDKTAATFCLGAPDVVETAQLTLSGDELIISWDSMGEETLTKVTDSADDFVFLSNVELAELAISYCKAINGIEPVTYTTATLPEGMVSINLFENEEGAEPCAEYTVDRFTAIGTDDLSGEPVNLTEAAVG